VNWRRSPTIETTEEKREETEEIEDSGANAGAPRFGCNSVVSILVLSKNTRERTAERRDILAITPPSSISSVSSLFSSVVNALWLMLCG
jgi:hypothetical protein